MHGRFGHDKQRKKATFETLWAEYRNCLICIEQQGDCILDTPVWHIYSLISQNDYQWTVGRNMCLQQ